MPAKKMKRSAKTRSRMRNASKERRLARGERPDRIDVAVGQTIKKIRLLRDMTQHDLGEIVGVRFQQIQKYESAQNRMSASMLEKIADALDVTVAALFGEKEGKESRTLKEINDANTMNLIRSYLKLQPNQQAHIRDSIKVMLQ